jgi:hypothetical protein
VRQAPPLALKSEAKIDAATIAPRSTELPTVNLSDVDLASQITAETGLQFVSGQLQNIGGFRATATAAAPLASQGGTVLAATLDNSVIRNNTFTRMTVATMLLGEPGNAEVLANQADLCGGGFWFLTPSQTQDLLLDPQGFSMFGATVALGYPLPQGDTSTNAATVAAAPASVRIHTGTTNHSDSNKNVWLPDASAKNVTISTSSVAHPAPPPTVTDTSDPTLYQSERYGPSFSYTFNSLTMGYYSLTLKFAEIFYTNPQTNKGVRVFDVAINGEQILTNFDIVADAGGADTADDYTFIGIVPNGAGQIVVQFTGTSIGSDGNAKIDAAELDPEWTGAPYLGAGNESESATFFDQLAQLAYQGYANLGYSLAQLRIQDNEIHYVTNPGLLLLGDDSLVNGNSGSLMMSGNRIDGELTFSDYNFAKDAGLDTFRNVDITTLDTAETLAEVLRAFAFLVVILRISRCLVTSNMLTTGNPTDGYGPSIFLNDALVQQAEIAVMSNVLTGSCLIVPGRNLASTDIAAVLQTWQFLNTIIT